MHANITEIYKIFTWKYTDPTPRIYRSSVNRLIPATPALRGLRTSADRGSAVPSPRYTTGVPPLVPSSNLCPLRTVNPASVMNGPCDPSHPGASSVDVGLRRRRNVRRRTPRAARRATPPRDPTIAGTRGTVEDEVDVGVEGAVLDEVGEPGTPGVGESEVSEVKSTLEVSPVVQLVNDVDVPFLVELNRVVQVAVGAAVMEERLKNGGTVVKEGKGRVVILEGRLERMSLGPIVGAIVCCGPVVRVPFVSGVIEGSTVVVGGTSVCWVEDVSGEGDETSVPSD
jgi:hypothetical protein